MQRFLFLQAFIYSTFINLLFVKIHCNIVKKTMCNIEKYITQKRPFSLVVSYCYLAGAGKEVFGYDYFMIVAKKNHELMKLKKDFESGVKLKYDSDDFYNTKLVNKEDEKYFIKNRNKFKIVANTEHGRVYEFTGLLSLQTYINQLKTQL